MRGGDRPGDGQAEPDAVADAGSGLQAPERLEQRGLAAWTLAAFAIGALAGMLIRRVVPAIVATLAGYAALAFAAGGLLRQHYLTPLVTSNPTVPGSAWILSRAAHRRDHLAGPASRGLSRHAREGPRPVPRRPVFR